MWLAPIIPLVIFLLGGAVRWKPYSLANDMEKRSPYECGFSPFSTPRSSFSIYFFLLAILFLVFDVEVILLLPLPYFLCAHPYSKFSLFSFIVVLVFGLYHE